MNPLVTDPQRLGDSAHRRAGRVQPANGLVEVGSAALDVVLELTKLIERCLRLPDKGRLDVHVSSVLDAGRSVY